MALALAAVSHAYQYVLVTGLGLFFLWRMGLSLRTLQTQRMHVRRKPLSHCS